MDLSVIIVNWNTRDLLAQCLQSVSDSAGVQILGANLTATQDPSLAVSAEVFVVDNGSTDGSTQVVRDRFPWAKIIANCRNLGFARANNQALAQATGRYALLLNSDALLQKDSLASLLCCADEHPEAGAVGAKLLNVDGSFQSSFNDFPTVASAALSAWGLAPLAYRNPYFPSHQPEDSEHARSCDWVSGACLLARREAIAQVGLLDEGFFMNCEETDWCYRMIQCGWRVLYCPDTQVVHLGGASADRVSAQQRMRLYASTVRYFAKHHGRPASKFVSLNYRLGSLVRSLVWYFYAILRPNEGIREKAHGLWAVSVSRRWS